MVDNAGDVVSAENLNEGTDTVYSNITWTLGANFEHLTLTGAGAINGTGNTLDNIIIGNTGNNLLLGGAGNDNINGFAGNDSISGGAGNDTLDGDLGNDSISGGAGTDIVRGGAGDDLLEGGADADTLDGGVGNDSMIGGAGNDVYFVSDLSGTNPQLRDIVFELPGSGSGIDLVNSSVSVNLLFDNVENLTLTGSENINGIGNSLTNVIKIGRASCRERV